MHLYLPIILLFIGGLIITVGDVVMKKWVITSLWWWYPLGLVFYLGGLMFLAETYKYRHIAGASLVLVLFNVSILALVSWLYFKEPLAPLQLVGIGFGFVGVILLESHYWLTRV